jgi:hypothetical protein
MPSLLHLPRPSGDAAGNDILVGDARYGAFHRFIEPDELRFSGIQIADLRLTQLVAWVRLLPDERLDS